MGEDNGNGISTTSGKLLSKDVRHLEVALAETRIDIREDIAALRASMKESLDALRADQKEWTVRCNDNRLEIVALKEQMKQGDKNTSTIAAIVSAAFATIASVVTAILGGKQ